MEPCVLGSFFVWLQNILVMHMTVSFMRKPGAIIIPNYEVGLLPSLDEPSDSACKPAMTAAWYPLAVLILLKGFGLAILTALPEVQASTLDMLDATSGYVSWIP